MDVLIYAFLLTHQFLPSFFPSLVGAEGLEMSIYQVDIGIPESNNGMGKCSDHKIS